MAVKRKVDDVIINKDRLSELPKNLIESILERIGTKEVARTSTLSTKWRYIWISMPKLVLDWKFFGGLKKANKKIDSARFVQIVDSILMLHNGPIKEFDIYIPFDQTPNMDLWMLHLSRNGVKELTLHKSSNSQPYKLASYIFSCDHLTRLSLTNCVLNTPLQCTGFCNLRKLYLGRIKLSTNTGSLISKLPLLSELSLWLCRDVKNIKTLPPNLFSLKLFVYYEVPWQWFESKTKLSFLHIHSFRKVENVDVQAKNVNLSSFLLSMPNIDTLRLDRFFLKFLAAGGSTQFPKSHNLKNVTFTLFDDLDEVSCALRLLISSPNLEKLEILAYKPSNDASQQHELSDIMGIADSDLEFKCLRRATIRDFSGLKVELAFVKLILSHSPVLQQMVIKSIYGIADNDALSISRQLMRFCRASIESEIIYD